MYLSSAQITVWTSDSGPQMAEPDTWQRQAMIACKPEVVPELLEGTAKPLRALSKVGYMSYITYL